MPTCLHRHHFGFKAESQPDAVWMHFANEKKKPQSLTCSCRYLESFTLSHLLPFLHIFFCLDEEHYVLRRCLLVFAKGRTIRYNRRGSKNFSVQAFFLRPTCLQEFFSGTQALHEFLFFAYRYISLFFATHLTFTQELSLISLLLYYFISQICSLD